MTYKQTPYMDHTHPDAFLDWPKRSPEYGATKECPRCKGHGGWNLLLNAYNMHGMEDTAENRHKFAHFRQMCGHCYGWGYVAPEEDCPGHDWKHVATIGRCLNRYECIHCQQISDVDSSD